MREPQEEPLNPAQSELGEALARLKPATTALDPARIRWEAQRRRASRQVWWWRGVAAALALALVLSLLFRPQPRTVVKLVYASPSPGGSNPVATVVDRATAPEPPTVPATAVLEGGEYLAVRGRVLAYGVRALPPPPPAPSPVAIQRPTDAVPNPGPTGHSLIDWLNPLSHEGRS